MSTMCTKVELTSELPPAFAQPMPPAYPIALVSLKACVKFEGMGSEGSGAISLQEK